MRSIAPLFIALVLLFLRQASAQQFRSIPTTPENQQFFALSQSLLDQGDFSQSSCGPQRPDLIECIQRCNAPGPKEREGCCCIVADNSFFVGIRGGCRYNQTILRFSSNDNFIYQSTTINSDKPNFDKTSCAFTEENANRESCTCTLQWEATADRLAAVSPLPTPSNSPSPVLSAVMSIPPVRPPEPSPDPTKQPSVEPTTTPTVIAPPTSVTTAPPAASPTASPTITPGPTDDQTVVDMDGSVEPSISPGDDDGDDDDDDTVCVDHQYLINAGYPTEHLIHGDGVMSPVLCPRNTQLPCGSANHMIRANGVSMSYLQLCDSPAVECESDHIKVNSVYTHLWNEVAHGDHVLTMYDIRYPERAQRALHSVMHKMRTVRKRFA